MVELIDIPNEILDYILEFLHTTDFAGLGALRSTSRLFYDLCNPIYYRSIQLNTYPRDEELPMYQKLPVYGETVEWEYSCQALATDIVEGLVQKLQDPSDKVRFYVRDLTIGPFAPRVRTIEDEDIVRMIHSMPYIRDFRWASGCKIPKVVVEKLASKRPDCRLHLCSPIDYSSKRDADLLCSPQLASVQLFIPEQDWRRRGMGTPLALTSVLPIESVLTSLRVTSGPTFQPGRDQRSQLLTTLLFWCGQTLRSLETRAHNIRSSIPWYAEELLELAEQAPYLEELSIELRLDDQKWPVESQTALKKFARLRRLSVTLPLKHYNWKNESTVWYDNNTGRHELREDYVHTVVSSLFRSLVTGNTASKLDFFELFLALQSNEDRSQSEQYQRTFAWHVKATRKVSTSSGEDAQSYDLMIRGLGEQPGVINPPYDMREPWFINHPRSVYIP